MKFALKETPVIFISTVKWSILAIAIGIIVGLSTTLFLNVLNWSIAYVNNYEYYFLLLPVVFFVSALLIHYLAPDAEGHGTEKVIEAVHRRSGKIHLMVVPVKLVASVITIAFGGSTGKEGPCAQIGGGLSSLFSDIFRFGDNDRKRLVICGVSAAFASVFGTPVAGAIFGVEVLFIGQLLYDVLLPSFIAGIVSFHISAQFGIRYFHHTLNFLPVFSEAFFLKIIAAGIVFGLVSLLVVESMRYFKELSSKLRMWKPLKGLVGGAALVGLTFIFSDQYLGLGLDTIQSALEGTKIVWYAFLVKIAFTSITLNFEGSGGVVTPIFFIGASSGSLLGALLGMDPATASAIGLVAVVAGTTNTPIASSIMAIELFGAGIAPYASLACVISFLMTGHKSIYPSQVISMRKSASIQFETGGEVENVKTRIQPREKSVVGTSIKVWGKINKMVRNKP
jgi:H+/Cl- antiporter ClcA